MKKMNLQENHGGYPFKIPEMEDLKDKMQRTKKLTRVREKTL